MKTLPLIVMTLAAAPALATDFQLTPVKLPGGVTLFGTVSTDGTVGTLQPSNIVAWNVTVRASTRYDYTPVNAPPTSLLDVAVTSNGRQMRVKSAAGGNGGALAFGTYMPEVGVHVANYSVDWPGGLGFSMFQYGADFEYLDLPVDPSGWRVVAQAKAGSTAYKLVPVVFPSGATLSGVITTDGSTGAINAAQLLDWHLTVRRDEDTVYFRDVNGSNSVVLPGSGGLSTDGQSLFVARPGGYLGFGVPPDPPARGRGAVPADFTAAAPRKGQAGYFDPFNVQYVPLHFSGGLYTVGQTAP